MNKWSDAPTIALPETEGFSPRGESKEMSEYRRKLARGASGFTWILALLALVGFPIYGALSGELDMPESMYYGLGLAVLFFLIGTISRVRSKRDKNWDGMVERKEIQERLDRRDDGSTGDRRNVYILHVRDEMDRLRSLRFEEQQAVYDYFQVGDRVRHHAGFPYPEKGHKAKDEAILCISCASFNSAEKTACRRCGCPVMRI